MAQSVSRRWVLATGAVIGGGLVVEGAMVATSAEAAPPDRVARVTIAIARAGAVFPSPFPAFDDKGTALSRATLPRLRTRYAELSMERRERVVDGAAQIAGTVNLSAKGSLLRGLSHLYVRADAEGRGRVDAVVALAVATISSHFPVDDDAAAQLWLAGLVGSPAGGLHRGAVRLRPAG